MSAWGRTLRLGIARGRFELLQFFRERDAVVFTFAFPAILLAIFGSIFGNDVQDGVSFGQYFAAGIVAVGLVNSGFQNLAIGIPVDRDDGTLKRLRGTPLPPAAYFVGKVVLVLALSAAQVVLLLAVGAAFFDLAIPTGARALTFGWLVVLSVAVCTLLGIAFSSVPRSARSAAAVVTPFVLVLQFTSGVFVRYTDVPTWMQQIAAVFPLKWMAQGMRSVFLPEGYARAEVAGSWELGRTALVLTAWLVLGVLLARATFRWTRRGER